MALFNWGKTFKGDNPPKSTTRTFVGVSTFRDACYQLVAAFLLTYITFSGLLGPSKEDFIAQMAVISVFIILCRIWDGVNDPIMGWIIEKFHFKSGKYRPWILIGGILNTIVVLTLFLARPTGWGFVVLFAIFYFLWDFAWTINDIAYWSMLPSLTSDEKRRNSITTWMQVFISIGVFGIFAICSLLPSNAGNSKGTADTYSIIAVVTTVLYLISQIVLCLVVKERDRSEEEALNKGDQSVKIKDIFKLFKTNDQFKWNIIAIFLSYFGEGVLVAFATYYFYFAFGYGGGDTAPIFALTGQRASGAGISFLFTIMYAVGTLLAQVLYPLFTKFMKRKAMLIMSCSVFSVGYLTLFLLGIPVFGDKALAVANPSLLPLLYVAGVLIFFGHGILAVAILIQMQSTIEYNEYKNGERKEALVSSMRAMAAKWASALQQGLIFGTLALAGLYEVTNNISEYENLVNQGLMTKEQLLTQANGMISSTVTPGSMRILSVGMIIIPLAVLVASILICTVVFKIDEAKYDEIMTALKARRAQVEEVQE